MESFARVWALISLLVWTSLASAEVTPDQFTYQGQIIRPDGTALEGNNVDFFIEILSPTDDCVLYREHHSLNMEGSNGIFSLRVGDGAPHGGGLAASTPLSQALSNSSGPFLGYDCDGGPGDYTPTSTDRRKLRLTFNDGSGNNTIAHDHELLSAPYAFSAQTLEGYTPGDFVRINDESPSALSQANLETVFTETNYVELLALLDGSSASFTVGTITTDLNLSNNRIVNLEDPMDANDATNKNYVDSNIGGQVVDPALATIGAGEMGQVLTWSGTQWQTQTVVDPTKLPLDGGTMTGAIVMDGNDISGVQNLGVNNDATVTNDLSVGNDLSVDENVLVGGGIGVATGINSDGNVSIYQQQALQLTPEASTGTNNYVGFRAPAALSDTQIWTLPGEDGQAGQVMRTDGSGNLDWITVTMDGASFLAEDGTALQPSIAFEDNADTGLYRPGADSLAITTGGSERLRVTDSGWVGIGTTTPETLLDVAGGVRIGEEAQPCVGALAGTLQYDPLEDEVQFCDGSTWVSLGTSSTEGTVTSITAGAGLDGGTITDNGTIDVATGGIIESMLANNAVSNVKIQNNAVTTDKILNGAVTDDKLATDSVTSDKIAAGAVGSAQIAENAVTSSELADDAVGSDQILNGAVTNAKIDSVDGSKVSGNIDGNAAGFTGVLAGDVTGEQGSTVVGAIRGQAVAATAPTNEQVLQWDAGTSQWVPADLTVPAGADAWTVDGSDIYRDTGNVGIGLTNPATRLDVAGAVKVGEDVALACGAPTAGAIRYEGGNVEYCNGSTWAAFGTSSSTGTVTEITAGTGLDGGTITETGTISIAAGGVSATELASDAVTTDKILNGAVTDAKINDVDMSKVTGLGDIADRDAAEFLQVTNNLSDLGDAAVARGNLGLGTMATESAGDFLTTANNLSDVADAATARGNLGLGDSATLNVGTTAGTVTAGDDTRIGDANRIQGVPVASTTPTDGQVLIWNVGTGDWEPMEANAALSFPLAADPAGDATAPAYSFEGDTNTGMYSSGANTLSFTTDGSERVRITSDGQMGIGIAVPATRLDVAGAVRVGADGALACGAPTAGALRYEGGNVEFCNGSTWAAFGTSSSIGTVTEITAGVGLEGGPITETGTLSIATGGVTEAQLANDAVTTEKILNEAVTSEKIAANAVTETKIADGAVTDDKIDSVSGDKVTGNITGDAAGFTGVLAGDVVGGQINTELMRIRGRNVSALPPAPGQFMAYVDSEWRPVDPPVNSLWSLSGADVYRATGRIGIGTDTPLAPLDVRGELRVSSTDMTCDGSNEGLVRYNTSKKSLEFCDGNRWTMGGLQSGVSQTAAIDASCEPGDVGSLARGPSGQLLVCQTESLAGQGCGDFNVGAVTVDSSGQMLICME